MAKRDKELDQARDKAKADEDEVDLAQPKTIAAAAPKISLGAVAKTPSTQVQSWDVAELQLWCHSHMLVSPNCAHS